MLKRKVFRFFDKHVWEIYPHPETPMVSKIFPDMGKVKRLIGPQNHEIYFPDISEITPTASGTCFHEVSLPSSHPRSLMKTATHWYKKKLSGL